MNNPFESVHAISNYDSKVIGAMETYGGSFVKQLAVLFRLADAPNYKLLKATFPVYWNQYVKMAFPVQPSIQLNEKERAILKAGLQIIDRYGEDMSYFGYWRLDDIGTKKELQPHMKRLWKELGLLTFARGLMNDDGEVTGAGYSIPYGKYDEVKALLESYGEELTK